MKGFADSNDNLEIDRTTYRARETVRMNQASAPQPLQDDQIEKYSSAITLSDMEIFIFPELLYGLVLANIMSPKLWEWRNDRFFRNIERKTPYRRVMRLKQFIMDHYEFNLDLETWGLTTKDREIERFRPWISPEQLAESNALFGYTGDQYYFDIDIRRHFGLDKYTTDVIPYWKTETLEAMDAFRYRDGYSDGAGECVSLATLYAAAAFVVCRIPLEDIFLMATPLHSQNFIDVRDGILTNNRRIVTKTMWFNGTELSYKAQRALRNEQVTIVADNTGCVHVLSDRATMDPSQYGRFKHQLRDYLQTSVTSEILANFLRQHSQLQKCFQIEHNYHGKPRYIAAEKVYAYEHGSPYRVSDETREKLLADIDEYEFYSEPLPDRMPLNKFDDLFREREIDLDNERDRADLMKQFDCYNARSRDVLADLRDFITVTPRFPDADTSLGHRDIPPIALTPEMDRDDVLTWLRENRHATPVADLAFYAYRDLAETHPAPFLKAAVERNPVSIEAAEDLSDAEVIERLAALPNESIYDGSRAAQPDEVWNFGRGDGLERILCLANILKSRHPDTALSIEVRDGEARLSSDLHHVTWPTEKAVRLEGTPL